MLTTVKYTDFFIFADVFMNRIITLEDLQQKDFKKTWDYQTHLLQQIVDTKISNRRNDQQVETKNHFFVSIQSFFSALQKYNQNKP